MCCIGGRGVPKGVRGDVFGDACPLDAPGEDGVHLMHPTRARLAGTEQQLLRAHIPDEIGQVVGEHLGHGLFTPTRLILAYPEDAAGRVHVIGSKIQNRAVPEPGEQPDHHVSSPVKQTFQK
jgi:hypothetical protein